MTTGLDANGQKRQVGLENVAEAWATPKASNTTGAAKHGQGGEDLQTQADGWMTPTGADSANRTYQNDRHNPNKPRLTHCGQAENWATPKAADGQKPSSGKRASSDLTHQASGWATPSAQEFGGSAAQHLKRKQKAIEKGSKMGLVVSNFNAQIDGYSIPKKESSTKRSSSSRPDEATKMGGVELLNFIQNWHPSSPWRLNPLFSHWLMRLPIGWIGCALSETELTLWCSRWRSRLFGIESMEARR